MYNIQLNVRGSRPEILYAQTPIRIDVLHRSEKDQICMKKKPNMLIGDFHMC